MDTQIRIEGFWRRLRARVVVARMAFSDPEGVLALVTLLPRAQESMKQIAESAQEFLRLTQIESEGLRAEVARMNRVASEDAKMLLAYSRWCEKNGCLPTSRDLMDMVK